MTRLSSSLLVTVLSKGWSAFLGLAVVPLYVHFLGVESYGVIGGFVSVQVMVSLLDFGLSTALTRTLAASIGDRAREQTLGGIVRTIEAIYWAIALLIALGIWLLAPVIAHQWLRPEHLSADTLTGAIRLAGISLALQWPVNLYSAGLAGMQRQLLLGGITFGSVTIRVAVTAASLWLIAPTLTMFFVAQAAANLLQTAASAGALWFNLHKHAGSARPIRPSLLKGIWGFAAGMTGISLTVVLLTQMDKTILSRTLQLEAFGYYVVASTLASGLYVFISPMFAVLYPRFSELVSRDDRAALLRLYALSSQLLAVILLPLSAVLAAFAADVLLLWTGNEQVARNGHVPLALLVAGNAVNGLMNVPYAVQLAHGWTALTLLVNVGAICLFAPAIYILSTRMGSVGGAIGWAALMVGTALPALYYTHRRFELGSVLRWLGRTVALPAIAAVVVVFGARALLPPLSRGFFAFGALAGVLIVALAAALVAAPDLRVALAQRLALRAR